MPLFLILLILFCAAEYSLAAGYVPVDELGRNAPSLSNPRIRRHLPPGTRYNPRMRGVINRPKDPNVGKWVSPPAEYIPEGVKPEPPEGAVVLEPPAAPAEETPRPKSVRLFGTVEMGRPLGSLPGWLDVIRRNEASPIFQAQKYFDKKTNWENLRSQAAGQSRLDQLRLVNRFWNTFPYREDISNWGQPDYWEIPDEFLRKSGDCEDYAIVKYFTLKELGFDPQKMRIVVLKDTVRNLAHAVLAVYMDDDAYILDNLSNAVMSHKRMGNYSPQYSVNEYGRWAHIKSKSRR